MSEVERVSLQLDTDAVRWFFRGVRGAVSVPALILATAFVGFGSLAREAGFPLSQTLFMILVVWALPAKVVFIGAVTTGATLPAVAFAVTLSSIRLTPMVVTLVPELRSDKTRPWVLYLLSHCVAVTSWVLALERLPDVPRHRRTAYYGGLGWSLIFGNMLVVVVVYSVAGALPTSVSGALLLLTPIYFLTSLWGSARERAGHIAMVLGLVLGPVFHVVLPGFELLAAGLLGGALSYGAHLLMNRKTA